MIQFQEVSYEYQEAKEKGSLKHIGLKIYPGELVLVVGKSGCGKTTLSKCINGLIPYFHEGSLKGEILLEGKKTIELSLSDIGEKVGSVFQDPRSQFFTTDTWEEVAFGCQNMGMERKALLRNVEDAFSSLGIETLKDRSLFTLSSGEKQKIALASCYSMGPKIFLLDEPSANLDYKSTLELAKLLKSLKDKGHTIIVMEHRLHYLSQLIDRVIYMKEGQVLKAYSREEALAISEESLVEMGLRQFDLERIKWRQSEAVSGANLKLKVEALGFSYVAKGLKKNRSSKPLLLNQIGFEASGGEIIGLIGENGAGKTTLAKVLAGLLKEQVGTVLINGKSLSSKARIKNAYFVLQDSDYQLFTESVREELRLGNEKQPQLEEKIVKVLENLGLEAFIDTHPAALSRGQKQRVTIASALLSEAQMLFLDEPTSGLDGESMREVVELLHKTQETGKLIFVISHDYEFLVMACTRILGISEGTIKEDFKLNTQTICRLKKALRMKGGELSEE